MRFYKTSASTAKPKPPQGAIFPCFIYVTDGWDDFSHKTLFRFHYFKNETLSMPLGEVKILQADAYTTTLPRTFSKLNTDFVSLGQDLEYYETVRDVLKSKCRTFLSALNDVVVKPQLLDGIETQPGFRNSLIRFNDAKIALRDGNALLEGVTRKKGYHFNYASEIPGAETTVNVSFDLDPTDPVPGSVVAIIGRNGVGKTQFLARLARDLATPQRMSKKSLDQAESAFESGRPLFSRVIALSFSAFDKFQRPEPKEHFSYIYCGVRDDSGKLSRTSLEQRHLQFLKRIQAQDRESLWEDHVQGVMEEPGATVSLDQTIRKLEEGDSPSMSSGQSILIYFISASLAYLKEDSLLLFDEPEIHLHPNAVASLMQILQKLLRKFHSYAILATHSPVVIQEVPRKRVIRFEREGNITTAYPLSQESFGENISELTRQVFETVEIPNFYKAALQKLAEERSYEEVSSLFGDQLSMHAAAYLASLYGDDEDA